MGEQQARPADRRLRDESEDGLVQLTEVAGSGVEVTRSEERADVGVERVARKRVRLVKRVVVEQKTIELRREELHVEELPGGGAPLPDDTSEALTLGRGAPFELVLREEVAVVETRVVPRERVRVTVDRIEGAEGVTVGLRREEVVVEEGAGRRD